MRVGFDLDGVLYDFGESVRRYLDSIGRPYGWKDDSHEPHSWNFFEYWGMDYPEFKQICNDGADAGFVFCGPARDNAVETVWKVHDMGHEIIILTDRQFGTKPEVSHEHTKDWWFLNGFPDYDELHFTADKTSQPVDIMVEDKLENYDALMAAGTECYLINRAWNLVPGDDRLRINDISDYAGIVAGKTVGMAMV